MYTAAKGKREKRSGEKSAGQLVEKGTCTYHVVVVERAFKSAQTVCTTGRSFLVWPDWARASF